MCRIASHLDLLLVFREFYNDLKPENNKSFKCFKSARSELNPFSSTSLIVL